MEKTKITGRIIWKGNVVQVNEKFTKREFTIQTADKFPQEILVQLSQDRVDVIENVRIGDVVDVFYNLRGRSWTDPKTGQKKWFNTIEAWAVTFANAMQQTPAPQIPIQQPYQQRNDLQTKSDDFLNFDQSFNLPY